MGRQGRYTGIAIGLHWVVAILIAANLLIVWTVDLLPDSFGRPMIDTHKSIGITVLGLAIMRVLWRLTHTPPVFPAGYATWERRTAHAAHLILYLLLFCLPLSGWAHDSAWKDAPAHPMYLFGVIPWPRIGFIESMDAVRKESMHDLFGQIHASFAYVLYAMVTLHILGALKHQFLDGEAELQRMWPARRRRRGMIGGE